MAYAMENEGNVSPISSSPNVQTVDHIELLDFPSHRNSQPSSSAVRATKPKKSTSTGKLHVKVWARVTNLCAGWWARIHGRFVGCWARFTNWYVKWWARLQNSFVDWWMGELLAILLSIITLFAVIIILRKHDDRSLSTFSHNVSLNFVVSTLATVSKSSLLLAVTSALSQFKWLWVSSKQRRLQDLQVFDEASRGPWGASRLLISKRSLSWATIGAIITILCLIYDPFIQGLIQVSERVVYKNNPASLVNKIESFPHVLYGFLSAEYTLINTINNAAFNPKPLLETQPRCPTGNCTWPPFTSLGFCFKCQNVSQLVRDSSTYVDRFEYIKSSTVRIPAESARPRRNYTWSYTWRTYNYKFPELNGQILHTTPVGSLQHSLSTTFETSEGRNPAFFVIQLGWDGFTAFNFTDGASIPTVSLLLLIRTSTQQSHPGGVLAADLCALSFCAQKRKVSMVLNQLSSVILETVHGTKNVQSKPVQDGYATEDDLEAGLSFTGADFNMSFSELGFGKDPSLWLINLEDLIKAFEGNLSGTPGSSAVPKATSNFIGAFNASSNISMTMNNIATAMTNYFRDSSNITVTGQVGQTESYVHVNWLWIILPAFLVLAGTIFLLLAMFESKRSGACVWKTSELALLFHGLETSHPELNAPHRSSEMEDMASKINVKMAITSDGRRILRQEKSSIMVT